ncbi:MAG: FAD-binding protein [Betaproteobacteria bacterium]|nr:FAD-binding protein [Betaproteobacteria bacterium]
MQWAEAGVDRQQVDVLVIGGGGGGMAAAAAAAECGRKVQLVEKADKLGGTTSGWSIGSISATNTPHQLRRCILDNPQHHFEDMGLFKTRRAKSDNPALRRLLTDNVTETFCWLVSLGIEFAGPMPEPPHRKPRMHTVMPNSRAYAYHVGRYVRKLGVHIRLRSRAVELVRDGQRVIGAVVECDGRRVTILAKATVLATGDFSGSAELKERFVSKELAAVDPINVDSTGDGLRLGIAVGGRVLNGDVLLGPEMRFVPPRNNLIRMIPPWRFVGQAMRWSFENLPPSILRPFVMSFMTTALAPTPALFAEGAILVNKRGERFVDEGPGAALALAAQPEKIGYILLDSALARKFSAWPNYISTAPGIAYAYIDDYRRNRKDIFHSASSLEALADRLGMSRSALSASLATARAARGGIDTGPDASGAWYALGPVKSYIVLTDGGLAVNERLQVLDAADRPIDGLYAAGSAGQGGVLLQGHGHHIGWAFTSGRLAGRHAAFETDREASASATVGA